MDLTFLTNCHRLNVYLKFLTFNLPNVTSSGARFIKRRPLHSAIKKRKKELRSLRKDTAAYEKDLAKDFFSIDKCILDNAIKKDIHKSTVKTLRHMRES